MASFLTVPAPLRAFFAYFPLHTYPETSTAPKSPAAPILWILPPWKSETDSNTLSGDVGCLRWQAYLALRGVTGIAVRWDISPDGGIDGRLPNLLTPGKGNGDLHAPRDIPSWVDSQVGKLDVLEGYKDQQSKDESDAWIALLENNVQAVLLLDQTERSFLSSVVNFSRVNTRTVESVLNPPAAPFSGYSSLVPPYGTHISISSVEMRYREAVSALSERLGTDKWFLGSDGPTALDALLFAYLHTLLGASGGIREEVLKRVNLVAWEWRVRSQVSVAFRAHTE